MKESASQTLPIRFFRQFLTVLNGELGNEILTAVLEKGSLSAELIDPQAVSSYSAAACAEAYARIQQAIRYYYGRGARGTLTRLGRLLWPNLLETASLAEKTQAQMVRTLPPAMRAKPTLELLARLMRTQPEGVTVHSLDPDLLLVDRAGAVTVGQQEVTPICHVTVGLAQEALFWATGREHDIEELACRATGRPQCELKITLSK